MDKQKWLNGSEIFDAYRVIPRLVLGAVLIFAGTYIIGITDWYMSIPAVDRTTEVSAFAGVTIPAVFGLAGKVVDWYLKTGRTWNKTED